MDSKKKISKRRRTSKSSHSKSSSSSRSSQSKRSRKRSYDSYSRSRSRSRSRTSSKSDSSRRRSDRKKPAEDEPIEVTHNDKDYKHKAMKCFKDCEDFPSSFFTVFDKLGFVKPTKIQANGIPFALNKIDMVGIARTGSGKTLAFILPALVAILEEKRHYRKKGKSFNNSRTPSALVLAPTRELAVQIANAAQAFVSKINVDMSVIYGGASAWPQKKELGRGVDLLIATPGRLLDFIEKENVYLDRVFYFVLDEADRMLDMGFIPQVKEIVRNIKESRQTLLWSATWPKEIEQLSLEICDKTLAKIKVGSEDLTINKDITQTIDFVEDFDKKKRIVKLLREFIRKKTDKILIFVKTKKGCDSLARTLDYEGYDAVAIHGDKQQNVRDNIIFQFKKGYKNILVATDVASRGLDIKNIKYVINFDFPMTIEDYIHRIGRTGRAGALGKSHTFFSKQDASFAKSLLDILKKSDQKIPEELFAYSRRSYGGRKFKRFNFNRSKENQWWKRSGDQRSFSGGYGGRGGGGYGRNNGSYNKQRSYGGYSGGGGSDYYGKNRYNDSSRYNQKDSSMSNRSPPKYLKHMND